MIAKADEKNEQNTSAEENPSMEEILQSIRGVISGDEAAPAEADDVLELTEMIEEAPQEAVEKPSVVLENAAQEKSILDEIDDALDEGPQNAEAKAEADITPDAVPVDISVEEIPEIVHNVVEEDKSPDVALAPEEVKIPEAEVIEKPMELDSQTSSEAKMNEINSEDTLEADIPTEDVELDAEITTAISGSLIADEVAKQSAGSLKALVNSVPEKHILSPSTRGGTTLEELAIEAMKPFLADWLNKNLSSIVKKIVEKEVKRLIPKEEDDD